jgi:NTP pyrophosphatase (non-canonical NTP hydrolase)
MNKEILDYIAALSKTDKKTLSQKALKTAEEVGELAKVILPFDGAATSSHRFVATTRILEEVADTVLCALSVAYSLGFTHDDISAWMLQKAKYWDEIQNREGNISYPLPYEIHLTVSGARGLNIDQFKIDCAKLAVKPLLIDLHNRQGETIMFDAQTSSVHMGDNSSAYLEMSRVNSGMIELGYEVVRQKIETVPWHPAAPSSTHSRPEMPKNCYFEAHFNIVVDDERMVRLRAAAKFLGAHLSRNAFKKISDTDYIMMLTYREYDDPFEHFQSKCDFIVGHLTGLGFDVPKTITEFSIYDTKVSHDAAWLVSK